MQKCNTECKRTKRQKISSVSNLFSIGKKFSSVLIFVGRRARIPLCAHERAHMRAASVLQAHARTSIIQVYRTLILGMYTIAISREFIGLNTK